MKFALVFDACAIRNIAFEAMGRRDPWDIVGVTRPVIIDACNEELWATFDDHEVPAGYRLALWDIDEKEEGDDIRDLLRDGGVSFYTPDPDLIEEL